MHAHAGIMQQLPVVHQHLYGDAELDGHRPRVASVDLLGDAVVHGADQCQRGLPAAAALALGSVSAAASRVVVSGVNKLVLQGA